MNSGTVKESSRGDWDWEGRVIPSPPQSPHGSTTHARYLKREPAIEIVHFDTHALPPTIKKTALIATSWRCSCVMVSTSNLTIPSSHLMLEKPEQIASTDEAPGSFNLLEWTLDLSVLHQNKSICQNDVILRKITQQHCHSSSDYTSAT